MKTTFSLILILSLLYSLTKAHGEYVLEPERPALLSISGTGIANTPPDEVQMTVSIQQQADSVDDLNELINNVTSAVTQDPKALIVGINILIEFNGLIDKQNNLNCGTCHSERIQDANVTDEDIESSNVAISPYYATSTPSPYGSPPPVSYQGKKTMRFTLKNYSDYDAVITDLYEAGINSVDTVVFQLSKGLLQAKTNEARKNAAANLLDSLDTLVGGLGLKVGQAYTVNEYTSGGDAKPYYGYDNARYAVVQAGEGAIVIGGEEGSSSSGSAIAPDDFVISSTINAQYYIV